MQKKFAYRLALSFALTSLALASAHAQVSVSVGVNQPGFFGRITVGDTPPPVIYEQPVVISPGPYAERRRPIYLRVPPGQERDWAHNCARYNACGQPVYFVRDEHPAFRDDHRHPPVREERRDDRRNY